MSVVGYQDFWVAGARCLFKRDAIDSVPQPLINLGLIKSVTPSITPTEIKLFDPAGGVLNLVDQAVTQQEEAYDINCANFNGENLALLFLSTPPESFTQSEAYKNVSHVVHPGYLLKIHDDDADSTPLFNISKIVGVWSSTNITTLTTLTSITPSTRTFSFSSNPGIAVSEPFVVTTAGSVSLANAGTYVAESISGSGPYLVVSVETPAGATQSGLTGTSVVRSTTYGSAGGVGIEGSDYDVVSLVRGEIRITDAAHSAMATPADPYGSLSVAFVTASMSGKRLITPQSIKGSVKGTMWLYLGRENDTRQSVRECRVSILPSGQNLRADDFSDMTLKVSVLSNITDDNAGRLIQVLGDLPDQS